MTTLRLYRLSWVESVTTGQGRGAVTRKITNYVNGSAAVLLEKLPKVPASGPDVIQLWQALPSQRYRLAANGRANVIAQLKEMIKFEIVPLWNNLTVIRNCSTWNNSALEDSQGPSRR